MLRIAEAPALRDLPIDLDELSLALEGDPLLTGGRIDLRTGDVHQIGPLYESDCLDELGELDNGTPIRRRRPGRPGRLTPAPVRVARIATGLPRRGGVPRHRHRRASRHSPRPRAQRPWRFPPLQGRAGRHARRARPLPPVHRRPPPRSRPAVARRIRAAPGRACRRRRHPVVQSSARSPDRCLRFTPPGRSTAACTSGPRMRRPSRRASDGPQRRASGVPAHPWAAASWPAACRSRTTSHSSMRRRRPPVTSRHLGLQHEARPPGRASVRRWRRGGGSHPGEVPSSGQGLLKPSIQV